MRFAIFGEIHCDVKALRRFYREADRLGIDRYICLGDIVNHNDPPSRIQETIDVLRQKPIVAVKGTHERQILHGPDIDHCRTDLPQAYLDYLVGLPENEIPPEAKEIVAYHEGCHRRMILFSGHREIDYFTAHHISQRIEFIAHTHKRFHFQQNPDRRSNFFLSFNFPYDLSSGYHLINPGTVKRIMPPFGFFECPSFVVYDSGAQTATFHRIPLK